MMAPRLPATVRLAGRRLTAPCIFLPRLPPTPSSAQPTFSPLLLRPTAVPTCRSSTWLLSALNNIASSSPNTAPPPKTLRAGRTLPYPPAQIYTLIADIDSYRHFLPHCAHSQVTQWTRPAHPSPSSDQTQPTRHPALADLTVGWGPFTQTYTSRVYCVPGSVVEAVSGNASTSIPADVLRSVGYDEKSDTKGKGMTMEGIFQSLTTRWEVKPAVVRGRQPGEWTEVTLSVTFQFANPALGFAVGQLADDKVDEMVVAFEERARKLYGR